jgi:hypothetical protein
MNMRKVSIFDIKPKQSSRPLQTGDNGTAYFKNVCYSCRKPFNRRKGRERSVPVVFSGSVQGAFLCGKCGVKFQSDSRMAALDNCAGPSGEGAGTGERALAFSLMLTEL